jgi:hypothetical protein
MNPLETYLNRATRGVWGKKKLEVIAELRGSIEARAWKLECLGFDAECALKMALREMGEAQAIAAGLTKVHTMPTILKSTLALGLFASIAITSLNSSQAQMTRRKRWQKGLPINSERIQPCASTFPAVRNALSFNPRLRFGKAATANSSGMVFRPSTWGWIGTTCPSGCS